MEKEKNSRSSIIIVVLIIIILVMGGYIFYDKVLKADNNPTNEDNSKTEEVESDCVKADRTEDIDLSTDEIIEQIRLSLIESEIDGDVYTDIENLKIDSTAEYYYSISFDFYPNIGSYSVTGFAYRENGKWVIYNVGSDHTTDELVELESKFCK
ncbi:MAG: hypothetical protein ACI4OG_00355 [Bacilli bacterium]